MSNIENSSRKEINFDKKLKIRVTFNISPNKVREAHKFFIKVQTIFDDPISF